MPIIITPTGAGADAHGHDPHHARSRRGRRFGQDQGRLHVREGGGAEPADQQQHKGKRVPRGQRHRREAHQEQQRSAKQDAVPAQAQPTDRQRDADRDGAERLG
jgi:hypothetical protein